MQFVIKTLKIENFKGIKEQTINFGDKRTFILSDNECGKTTISDSVCWLLTGKDSLGQSNFGIVPNNTTITVSPTVEIEAMIDDKPVNLKRIYKAKTNRAKKFTGEYASEAFINGIPKGIREFEEHLFSLFQSEEIFKLISNIKYFTENITCGKGQTISQRQRELLYSMITAKNDSELAQQQPEFLELLEPLKRYNNASDYHKALKAELSASTKQTDDFLTKIEQQSRNFVDTDCDEIQTKDKIAAIEISLIDLDNKLEELQSSPELQEIIAKIANLHAELSELEIATNKFKGEQSILGKQAKFDEKMKLQARITELQNLERSEQNEYQQKQIKIKLNEGEMNHQILEAEKHINTYKSLLENLTTPFNIEESYRCPTCDRLLPEIEIEQIKKKNEIIANEYKTKINELSIKLEPLYNKLKTLTDELKFLIEPNTHQEEINALQAKLYTLETELNSSQEIDMPDYETKSNKIVSEIAQLETELKNKKLENQKKCEEFSITKKDWLTELEQFKKTLFFIESNKKCQAEIDRLTAEQQETIAKKDKLTVKLQLVEKFLRYKSESLVDEINAKFSLVKFKLFDIRTTTKEIFETCIPMVNGTEYKDLSFSTKILASLDIATAFSKHYDIQLPIWIDNASEINTSFDNIESQLIILKCVPEDCHNCGGKTERKNVDGTWTCKECGNMFKKSLKVEVK